MIVLLHLPEKYSKEKDLHKNDCISCDVGRIFSNQSTSSTTFLPKFSLTCPKRTKQKHELPKQKRCLHFDLGCHFFKSKHVQRYCEGIHTFCPHFHRFCPDFKWFCPDFHQSKVLRVWLHPCTPASYTSGWRCKAKGRTQKRKCPMLRQQLHAVFSL